MLRATAGAARCIGNRCRRIIVSASSLARPNEVDDCLRFLRGGRSRSSWRASTTLQLTTASSRSRPDQLLSPRQVWNGPPSARQNERKRTASLAFTRARSWRAATVDAQAVSSASGGIPNVGSNSQSRRADGCDTRSRRHASGHPRSSATPRRAGRSLSKRVARIAARRFLAALKKGKLPSPCCID